MSKIVSPWRNELDDIMRGVAGAFLFGVPFLYTMEVWWKGNFTSPQRMLFALLLAYAALLVLNRAAGFRKEEPGPWIRTLGDSAEALALALVTSAVSLTVIGVLRVADGLDATMGRIVMESVPFSIGIGVANNFLNKTEEEGNAPGGKGKDSQSHQWHDHSWHGTLADAGATALGATLVAFSIAPTDEIPMIAAGLSPARLLVIIGVSLLLSYIIVFEANFGMQQARIEQPGIFQSPITETIISYLISLFMALVMLWLFQLLRAGDPPSQWLSYIIVLGLPATIGGAAGRIAF
ncbi:MAG TPA: TIGR02587 family membrane protein [Blastocatellia bacterium]|nr:TIGR02587 family membrane protein [Blastocatellia bacterium]